MRHKTLFNSVSLASTACITASLCALTHAQTPAEILRIADDYRNAGTDAELDLKVSVFKDGVLEKDRLYKVYSQSERRTLVLMQSAAEKGQKVLILADDFWLVMPNTQRPMRITPMQKLTGDAAVGDIATTHWVADYNAVIAGQETCNGAACTRLTLVAKAKSATYQKIDLWVGTQKFEPLHADLYLQSEKLAKVATFEMDKPGTPSAVKKMILQDKVSIRKSTEIVYVTRKARSVPKAWLNPMFLSNNPAID